MATIQDFLNSLDPEKTYTDQELRTAGTAFQLTAAQLRAVTSHDSKAIKKAMKEIDGQDVGGKLLRVVM